MKASKKKFDKRDKKIIAKAKARAKKTKRKYRRPRLTRYDWKLNRKVASMLSLKYSVVRSLARFDEDLVVPQLKKILQQKAKDEEDYRPYAALALGLIGNTKHFKDVATFVQEWRSKKLSDLWPKYQKRKLNQVVSRAVALFGTPEAFKLWKSLYEDEAWRERLSYMYYGFYYIKTPQVEHFLLRRLLCKKPKPKETKTAKNKKKKRRRYRTSTYSLMSYLSRMKTPSSRNAINQLLQIRLGQELPRFVKRVCKGLEPNIPQFRRRTRISSLVSALGRFRESSDLPRFANWALSDDRSLRNAARYVLYRYKEPEASYALLESRKRFPRYSYSVIRYIGYQRLASNEPILLKLLRENSEPIEVPKIRRRRRGRVDPAKMKQLRALQQKARNRRYSMTAAISALGHCGGFKSLLVLIGLQLHPKAAYSARHSVLRLSRRIKGSPSWSHKALMNAFQQLKTPEKKGRKRRRLARRKSRG